MGIPIITETTQPYFQQFEEGKKIKDRAVDCDLVAVVKDCGVPINDVLYGKLRLLIKKYFNLL